MVDLKQQFEQYQNDSTTITFETGNTIDNFLTNCTINDYERDFDEFTKEMALCQNVDIVLTKFSLDIKDETINYESALQDLSQGLVGTGISLEDLGLGESIRHESAVLTVEAADSWYVRLWNWIKQKVTAAYNWIKGLFSSSEAKLDQAEEALEASINALKGNIHAESALTKEAGDIPKLYWKDIKHIPGAIMFFEGIKTLMQKESEFFANHQNLVREINNLAKKALSTNPKDITYDILRKNRDKAIDLMKKMNSSDSPVAKLYNLVPEPNVYMQATTNFKGPNTIKVIGVKIENDNVSLVESSFTSKGALPSDNKVIKELNVGDLIKNSDEVRNGIKYTRNMFKQIVKEAKEESDKYNKQVNLESLSKEAKELYVKTLKENASNMNYLTKVGNGSTSLMINLVRFIAVCTKKMQAQ